MHHDYYFINVFLDAHDAADQEHAFRQAFQTIQDLGRQPAYRRGFRNYQRFMEEVRHHIGRHAATDPRTVSLLVDELIIALATNTLPGTEQEKAALRERILSRPDWRAKFKRICSDITANADASVSINIAVIRDRSEIAVVTFERRGEFHRVRGITPGHYVLRLSTGRVLWRGDLGVQDVEWGAAFPERAVDLAADTECVRGVSTRAFDLLEGELTVRILPGIEAGTMEISWKG